MFGIIFNKRKMAGLKKKWSEISVVVALLLSSDSYSLLQSDVQTQPVAP